jgi:hypothetical protein
MTNANCIRVLSVDDHPLLRESGYRREAVHRGEDGQGPCQAGFRRTYFLLVLDQLYEGVIPRQQTTAEKESSSRLGFPDQERQ